MKMNFVNLTFEIDPIDLNDVVVLGEVLIEYLKRLKNVF